MSCRLADTTLQWAYGEAPAAHAEHVAGCPECRALLAEHEAVASALGPALGALRAGPRVAARRRTVLPLVAGVTLLAAAALLAVVWWPVSVEPVGTVLAAAPADPLESELDEVDLEVADLERELR